MPESVTRWPPQWKTGLKEYSPINCSSTFNMTKTLLQSRCTHTHTHWKPQWHSLSLFPEPGEVPSELSWFVFFFIKYSICACRGDIRTPTRLTHGVWWDTPPLAHWDKNTHQSRAGLRFQPSPGPSLVNLGVLASVRFLLQSWLCGSIFFLLFFCFC